MYWEQYRLLLSKKVKINNLSLTVDNDILIAQIDDLLQRGKRVHFSPKGESMRPFIEGGKDTVVLVKTTTFQVGDIVLAKVSTTPTPLYVLHRIIAIKDNKFTLMGDGNLKGTEFVDQANVYGKVVQILTPTGKHKCVNRAFLWRNLHFCRRFLLKCYRKIIIPILYE